MWSPSDAGRSRPPRARRSKISSTVDLGHGRPRRGRGSAGTRPTHGASTVPVATIPPSTASSMTSTSTGARVGDPRRRHGQAGRRGLARATGLAAPGWRRRATTSDDDRDGRPHASSLWGLRPVLVEERRPPPRSCPAVVAGHVAQAERGSTRRVGRQRRSTGSFSRPAATVFIVRSSTISKVASFWSQKSSTSWRSRRASSRASSTSLLGRWLGLPDDLGALHHALGPDPGLPRGSRRPRAGSWPGTPRAPSAASGPAELLGEPVEGLLEQLEDLVLGQRIDADSGMVRALLTISITRRSSASVSG